MMAGLTTALMALLALVAARGSWVAWRSSSGLAMQGLAVGLAGLALFNALALGMGWRLELARGGSMLPSLQHWTALWVKKDPYGAAQVPRRGDVVVFDSPLLQEGRSLSLAKRIVGLPGDRVTYRGGELSINGTPVASKWVAASLSTFRQPGPLWLGQARLSGQPFEVLSDHGAHERAWVDMVVPPGHCFVMGDNWGNSLDSRDVGAVALERIHGKVLRAWGVVR